MKRMKRIVKNKMEGGRTGLGVGNLTRSTSVSG